MATYNFKELSFHGVFPTFRSHGIPSLEQLLYSSRNHALGGLGLKEGSSNARYKNCKSEVRCRWSVSDARHTSLRSANSYLPNPPPWYNFYRIQSAHTQKRSRCSHQSRFGPAEILPRTFPLVKFGAQKPIDSWNQNSQ